MPAIVLAILRLLAGFGGSALASKFGPPIAKKVIGGVAPGLLAALTGGSKVAGAVRGAGKFATDIGAFLGADALAGAVLGDSGEPIEVPPDPTVDDIRFGQPSPFVADQLQGLGAVQKDAQVRAMLEALAVDPDALLQAAGRQGGGLF